MRDIMPLGKEQHKRRADDGYRVVHDEGGEETHYEEDIEDEGVGALRALEYDERKVMEVPALNEGLPDHEHAEEKDHHVEVDCLESAFRSDGAEGKDGERPGEHYLPYGEPEPAYLPYCDEDEDDSEDYGGDGVYGGHIPIPCKIH